MRSLIFILLFIIGVGGAFFVNHYFMGKPPNHQADLDAATGYCTMACCLPYQGQLSDTQQKTLMTMEKDYCRCRDRLSREIDERRLALAAILLQKDPDMKEIDKLIKETANLQAELEKETINHILDIKAQLRPRDQERFVAPIVAEIRNRCFGRHGSQNKGSRD